MQIYHDLEDRKRAAWKRYIAYYLSKEIPKAKMTNDPEGRLLVRITTADAIQRLMCIEQKRVLRNIKCKVLHGYWPKSAFVVKVDPV